MPKFSIYQATDGWRWRLQSANGRTLASGEAFSSKRAAQRAVWAVITTALKAGVRWVER